MTDAFEDIREICQGMRDLLEQMLRESIGTSETKGACLHAAIILSRALTTFTGGKAQVAGGGPPMDGGVKDREGRLRGHYWVEGVSATGEAFVADVTADQFGYDRVVLLPLSEARARYVPGDAAVIAEHVETEMAAWLKIAASGLC